MSDHTVKSVPQDSREASTGLLARLCAAVSFGACCSRALPLSSVPPPVVVAEPAALAAPVVAEPVAPAAFAVIARSAALAAAALVAADPAPSSEDDLVVSRTESLQSE